MASHPYSDLPDHQFWRRAVPGVEPFLFDPVVDVRFRIRREEKVATAGSCFAQHISSRLSRLGFNYFVTEPGEGLSEERRKDLNYGVYSARFGNLYTTRQLLQLFEECFERRAVSEVAWPSGDGRFVDALRPQVTPGGYATEDEVIDARREHLRHVRAMFEECDVFVFTLGLTEAWRSRIDGTVYPLAPGVAGGAFDPARHEFVNLGILEVMADLEAFLLGLKAVNPAVKVVLTVSPVPLIATYEPRHVLVATTYSKSVLRVAAEAAYRSHDWVEYFPSFEIITGNYNDAAYYDADYRGINSLGVDHAMRCFLAHFTESPAAQPRANPVLIAPGDEPDIVCDEDAIAEVRP